MVTENYYDRNSVHEKDSIAKWFNDEEQTYLNNVRAVIIEKGYKNGLIYFSQTCKNSNYLNNSTLAYIMDKSAQRYGVLDSGWLIFQRIFGRNYQQKYDIKPNDMKTTTRSLESGERKKSFDTDTPNVKVIMYKQKSKTGKEYTRTAFYDTQKKRFVRGDNKK